MASPKQILIDGKTYVPEVVKGAPRKLATETLGERVARLRESKGWSVADLARELGVATQRIYQIEGDKNSLRVSSLRQLCIALDVSADELVFTREVK